MAASYDTSNLSPAMERALRHLIPQAKAGKTVMDTGSATMVTLAALQRRGFIKLIPGPIVSHYNWRSGRTHYSHNTRVEWAPAR